MGTATGAVKETVINVLISAIMHKTAWIRLSRHFKPQGTQRKDVEFMFEINGAEVKTVHHNQAVFRPLRDDDIRYIRENRYGQALTFLRWITIIQNGDAYSAADITS